MLCLFWAVFYIVNRHKYTYYIHFSLIAALLAVFFFLQAQFVDNSLDYRAVVWFDVVYNAVRLLFFPLVIAVFHRLDRVKNSMLFSNFAFMPAAVLSAMLIATYFVLGIPDASALVQTYHHDGLFVLYKIGRDATKLISLIYLFVDICIVLWVAYAVIDTNHIRYNVNSLNFDVSKKLHGYIMASMAFVLLCFFANTGLLGGHHWICYLLYLPTSYFLYGLFCGVDRIFTVNRRDQTVTVDPEETAEASSTSGPVVSPELVNRFEAYMTKDKPYLNPDLSLENVAASLGTNRTYVSSLVNQYYGMSFRMYINILRIEEAKSIMIQNPRMLVADVAERSGFSGVSQFVRKFKEISGDPPKVWSTTNNVQSEEMA